MEKWTNKAISLNPKEIAQALGEDPKKILDIDVGGHRFTKRVDIILYFKE